jgi:hypothetical protein
MTSDTKTTTHPASARLGRRVGDRGTLAGGGEVVFIAA